ncbi:hypothetical protein IA817_12575 [Listeria seeligeri]|uniref:hypothetical protein n=1 Tax=Listeria seeligeri TaxID=1640 RepID=UPI00162544C5|nr:hypothetical protein [Listeria seeligeri]MBC1724117.1 hypothetical protein [Listeria seeligeri]MBC1885922.1 hypothetical protein [Listeria seeligeri]MBF2347082.1 hypothetical protein [Listeria seeligeri]MBF2437315.1 hypothetical protein [Listeria seeligeri]MBF2482143.1 hypothetical protein [Listeria seeligeri]
MIKINYFYSPEKESEINLEIWKSFIDSGEEGQRIYQEHKNDTYEIQLSEVTEVEQGGLPAIVEEILTVSGMGALPILVVNNKVYKYGSFLLIDAIEDVLDIGLSIQVEEE